MHHLLLVPLVGGVFFTCCASVDSADMAGDFQKPSILPIIKQLGHNNFRVRQEAYRALQNRGEEALPDLRDAFATMKDPEIHFRLGAIISELQRKVLLTPKTVTLHMKSASMKEIADELSRQTGYAIKPPLKIDQKFTIDFDNLTFWQAAEKILTVTGHDIVFQGHQVQLVQSRLHPYLYNNGLFRIQASNFNYTRMLQLSGFQLNGDQEIDQFENNLNFRFLVQIEPKTSLLRVHSIRIEKAVDENDHSMVRQTEPIQRYFYDEYGHRSRFYQQWCDMDLMKPANSSRQAKIIKGSAVAVLLSEIIPEITIKPLVVGKKSIKAKGEITELEILSFSNVNQSYVLNMKIRKPSDVEVGGYHWANQIRAKMQLFDEKNNKYNCSQSDINVYSNDEITANFVFTPENPNAKKIGPPVQFVFNRWMTISQEIQFEFNKLPLP